MNDTFFKSGSWFLLFSCMIGCGEYEEKGVEENIYVNQGSLSLFVGEQVQLTASPVVALKINFNGRKAPDPVLF